MSAARHNPKVPGISPITTSPSLRHNVAWEELHTALDIILAAAANLRHYRGRLSLEDHATTVADIEEAVEQIANGLAAGQSPPPGALTGGRRRAR